MTSRSIGLPLIAASACFILGCPDPAQPQGGQPAPVSQPQPPVGSNEAKANEVSPRWVKVRPIFHVEGDTNDWYALFDAGRFSLEISANERSETFPLNQEDWNATGEALEWRTFRLPLRQIDDVSVRIKHNGDVLGAGKIGIDLGGEGRTEFNCKRGDRTAFRASIELQSISDGEATAKATEDLLRTRATFYARHVDEWQRLYNRGGTFTLELRVADSTPQTIVLGPEDWNRTLEDSEWKKVDSFPASRPVDLNVRILHDSAPVGEARLTLTSSEIVSLTRIDCRSGGLVSFTADIEFNLFRGSASPPLVVQTVKQASSDAQAPSAAWPQDTGDEMRNSFGRYCDANGLIGLEENPGINIADGNGVLFTSEALVYLSRTGKANEGDRRRLVGVIRSLQAKPGVINRNPPPGYHETQEGWDDYVGLTTAARVLGGEARALAQEVLEHGRTSLPPWFYNNEREGLRDHTGAYNIRATFGRAPWYIAHFYWCAGETPPEHLQMAWAACIGSYGPDAEDYGGWILQWLMIQALPDDAPLLCRSAARAWMKRFRARFPEGIRGAMAGYFRDPNHPLIRFAPGMDTERFIGMDDPLEAAFAELMRWVSEVLHTLVALASDVTARVERTAAKVTQTADRLEQLIQARTRSIVQRVNETQERIVRGAGGVVDRAGGAVERVLKRCKCVRAFGGCVGSCHGACGGEGCTCPGD